METWENLDIEKRDLTFVTSNEGSPPQPLPLHAAAPVDLHDVVNCEMMNDARGMGARTQWFRTVSTHENKDVQGTFALK
jgi:hypothetical protein